MKIITPCQCTKLLRLSFTVNIITPLGVGNYSVVVQWFVKKIKQKRKLIFARVDGQFRIETPIVK